MSPSRKHGSVRLLSRCQQERVIRGENTTSSLTVWQVNSKEDKKYHILPEPVKGEEQWKGSHT